MEGTSFRLYAKSPDHPTRFQAMDWANGCTVGNLIRATVFSAAESEKIRADIPALEKGNPGWTFQLRACAGWTS